MQSQLQILLRTSQLAVHTGDGAFPTLTFKVLPAASGIPFKMMGAKIFPEVPDYFIFRVRSDFSGCLGFNGDL